MHQMDGWKLQIMNQKKRGDAYKRWTIEEVEGTFTQLDDHDAG